MGYVVRVYSHNVMAYYVDCDTAEEAEQGYVVDGRLINIEGGEDDVLEVLPDVDYPVKRAENG